MSILCSMVGATFGVAAAAEVIRVKKGMVQVGTAQISTTQSKFGGSSLYAGSISSRVQGYQDVSQSGDFTVECWAYLPSTSSYNGFIDLGSEAAGRVAFGVNAGKLYINIYGAADVFTGAGTVSANTWNHIAWVRSGTTITAYLNGVSQGTYGPNGGTFGNTGGFALMGYINNGSGGYGDEFRISKVARYTANFTPSTTPFVNDDNTVLLMHANGNNASTFFDDDNGVRAPLGLIAQNQTQISTAQSKFGGSSIVFDGNDDYITVSGMPSLTGDYTFECWANFDILPWNQTLGGGSYMMLATGGSGDYIVISRTGAGSQVSIQVATANKYGSFTKSGVNLAINTWYHIAVVRNGGVFKCFFNGTDLTTFTNDSGFTNSGRTENMAFGTIGRFIDSRGSMDGYMDEIRVSSSARYTGDFTPSTAPFVNDSNTVLLVHCDGTNASTVFRDDNGTGRASKGIVALGNAQIDTAQSKFGGSSYLSDGTSDYLDVNPHTDNNFGTGDFTIEGWVRFNSTAGVQVFYDKRVSGGSVGILIYYNGGFIYHGNGSTRISGGTASTGVWYHWAVSRSSGSTKMFIDGTQVGSTFTDTLNYSTANSYFIGGNRDSIGSHSFNGWMDEVRISNSGRYTANFTAPTAPFQNDANTLLLLHMDGTDASTVFVDDNGRTTTP